MELFKAVSPHKPLSTSDPSEIRFVLLLPGSLNDPIHCTLEHLSLDTNPMYEAISYAWGDASITKDITLDDMSYSITTNLYSALKYIRDNATLRRLWIDALCINQTDLDERSREVARMMDIYRKATNVLIWIGDCGNDREEDIQALFGKASRVGAYMNNRTGSSPLTAWEVNELARSENALDLEGLLDQVSSRSWFYRVWVIQEISCHNATAILLCGKYCVRFMDLYRLRMVMFQAQFAPPWLRHQHSTFDSMIRIKSQVEEQTEDPSIKEQIAENLWWLMRETAGFKTSLAHDRLYGILGLLNAEELPPDLTPDYKLPISTVYQQYTVYLIQQTRALEVLRTAPAGIEGLPTWVAGFKFVDSDDQVPKIRGRKQEERLLEAQGLRLASQAIFQISPDGLELETRGLVLGNIVEVLEESPHSVSRVKCNLIPLRKALCQFEATIINRALELRPSLTRDFILDQILHRIANIAGCSVQTAKNIYNLLVINPEIDAGFSNTDMVAMVYISFLVIHRSFLLDDGRICFCTRHKKVMIGDRACLLQGFSKLCLLRKASDDDKFMWVGHGGFLAREDDSLIFDDAYHQSRASESRPLILV